MDFFKEQKLAKARSRRLLVLLAVSLLFLSLALYLVLTSIFGASFAPQTANSILEHQLRPQFRVVWNLRLFLLVLGSVVSVVTCAGLYKYATLSKGGRSIAANLGGRQILAAAGDPLERKLLNVVEEMSIASGIAMPSVFVLDEDEGINAFAAGFSPNEAVIGVTRGTIEKLSRDELQGVIAHEFSHILNGDMRLNLRLIALVHGLIFLSLIGSFIVRNFTGRRSSRSSKDNSALAILFIGVALWVLGSLGVLCSRLIKSSISRQREFLADAAAVQFTRNPSGIASALKKILFGPAGDSLSSPRKEEVSHFLFSNSPSNFFQRALATHPPLPVRIARLEPNFKITDSVAARYAASARDDLSETAQLSSISASTTERSSSAMMDSIGNVDGTHIESARRIRTAFPPVIEKILQHSQTAETLIIALSISGESETKLKQMEYLQNQDRAKSVLEICSTVNHLDPALRLPVVQVALGALKEMPLESAKRFLNVLRDLCGIDNQISFFEFALLIVVRTTLQRRFNIIGPPRTTYSQLQEVRSEFIVVLSRLSEASSNEPSAQFDAFQSAVQGLAGYQKLPQAALDMGAMSEALLKMRDTTPELKHEIVTRFSSAILSDNNVTIEEAEVFRAICATLDCPVPIAI